MKKSVLNAVACCRLLVAQREKVVQLLENCRANLAERLDSKGTTTCTGLCSNYAAELRLEMTTRLIPSQ
jgi:hypothetical protein